MSFPAKVYRVLIASPSDMQSDRKTIEDAIHDWNSIHAASEGAILLPVKWETDAISTTGERPQEIINNQLVRPADIVIGAFWTRVGSPTGKADSGTIEEIQLGLSIGHEVMLYFCDRSIPPSSINIDQHRALDDFKHWAKQNSIYFQYKSGAMLKAAIIRDLTAKIRSLQTNTGEKNTSSDKERTSESFSGPEAEITTPHPRKDLIRESSGTLETSRGSDYSSLDTGLMRRDLVSKACLVAHKVGPIQLDDKEIRIPFSVSNVGRGQATDVVVSVENAGETIFYTSPIRSCEPNNGTNRWELRVPRTPNKSLKEFEDWTFYFQIAFRDGLGDDQSRMAFRMSGTDPNFSIEELPEYTDVSTICNAYYMDSQ